MALDRDRGEGNERDDKDGLEPFRQVPVGTNDPNIVGEVGPYDIPPGSDPHDDAELHVDDDTDDDSLP